jgi:hypothetical protein
MRHSEADFRDRFAKTKKRRRFGLQVLGHEYLGIKIEGGNLMEKVMQHHLMPIAQ